MCIVLSRLTRTGVDFWLGLTLDELRFWMDDVEKVLNA